MQALLAAVIRGAQADWSFDDPGAERQLLTAARRHLVLPLVARQLRQSAIGERWPQSLRAALDAAARQHMVAEQLQRIELMGLARELRNRGVRSLLFKGAALAHTHYAHPCLRPRTDVDLLVAEQQVEQAIQVLRARSYLPIPMITGRLVTFQQTFVRDDGGGMRHACDLHWRIANRPAFARLLRWDELEPEAHPISALDNCAAAPATPHALLIACMHRVAHHHDAPDLIWVYDIHLLVSSMTQDDAAHFRALALKKGLAAICRRGLTLSQHQFGTALPAALLDLEPPGREPLAAYLRERIRPIDVLISDLRAVGGWRARGQLLGEHLFPPPDYLRASRGRLERGPLPLLYARRIVRGASRWLRPAAGER